MWLDEIEERSDLSRKAAKRRLGKNVVLCPETDAERMARVLREQSAYTKASHAVEEACTSFDPVDIGKLQNDRLNAWDNMSDDAKELLRC